MKNLEEDTLVDIVCKTAKKVMLDVAMRKNKANNKATAMCDQDSLEISYGHLDVHTDPPSLKAVEIANALRSKLGVHLLSHVRDVFGGLKPPERRPHIFRVVRIPKNDHVILLEGPTPTTSYNKIPVSREETPSLIMLDKAIGSSGSIGIDNKSDPEVNWSFVKQSQSHPVSPPVPKGQLQGSPQGYFNPSLSSALDSALALILYQMQI